MNFSLKNYISSITRQMRSKINETAELEQAIYELQCEKVYWSNGPSIRKSHVAKLQELRELKDYGYSTFIWEFGKTPITASELQLCFEGIFQTQILNKTTIDITEVDGLSASKSALQNFVTMEQFVEKECLRYFKVTEDDLRSNLSHSEIRIIHSEGTADHFELYGWSDRLFLSNCGGSHHFASAQYIAQKLSKPVPITANLYLHSIKQKALMEFNQRYASFLMSESDFNLLSNKFSASGLDFTFYLAPFLPQELVILFYRVGTIPTSLETLIMDRFTDFNNELIKALDFQSKNAKYQKFSV